jgi:hypothetical protein
MAGLWHHRQSRAGQLLFQRVCALLVQSSEGWIALLMPNASKRTSRDRRRQGAGKDEYRREASNEINKRSRCRDISADETERFSKRALYDRYAWSNPSCSAIPRPLGP